MDYLEGLFLGKLWSDTDFENRRHIGLFLLYGLVIDLVVAYGYFFSNILLFITSGSVIKSVILAVLFLASPFIVFRYYRMPLWGKLFVLLEKFFQSLLVAGLTVTWIVPRIKVQSTDLQDYLITYLNGTLEKYTERFYESAGSFATVIGVVTGGIHVVIVLLFWICVAVVFPGLVFLVVRLLQYGYDWLVGKFIIKNAFSHSRRRTI